MKITIDLASPMLIGIVTGIILMAVTGAWNFAKILFAKQIIEKKFFDLFSETESLHKKYKEEITIIKKKHRDELTNTIDHAIESAIYSYSEKMDELLKHNKPPPLIGRPAITKNDLAKYIKKQEG